MPDIAHVVHGAQAFGINLRLGNDGEQLVFDARHEPSEGMLERIAVYREAIVGLLKARRAASAIEWDRLSDLGVDEYATLVESVKTDLEALQGSLDRLERAGGAILPRMRERACHWGAAVESLLLESYNTRFERRRPKLVSNEEWLAALHTARLLELRGPQPPRGVIKP
jgi:hypothetical protein